MQWLARMVAVLLLTALAAAQPGSQVLALSAGPPLPADGCHGHMAHHGSSPATPAPASYQCCVNGHHAAIPVAAFSGHRLVALISGLHDDFCVALRSTSHKPSPGSFAPSSSPPGGVPLRI
jgi:hypothetical protein